MKYYFYSRINGTFANMNVECRKINTSPTTVDEKEILKLPLVTPPVRAIDLKFDLGTHVTARNRLGVTIKDALDVIYKLNKKRVGVYGSRILPS